VLGFMGFRVASSLLWARYGSAWGTVPSAEGLVEGAQPDADADSALSLTALALGGPGSGFRSYWRAGGFAVMALKYVTLLGWLQLPVLGQVTPSVPTAQFGHVVEGSAPATAG